MSLFDIAPWSVGADGFDPELLGVQESVFALSNGSLGWRATFEESEPADVPGAYLNGVFEQYEMPYAEEGFGYPDHGQVVVDVTDGKVIRLTVGDDPLDLRTGTIRSHERRLDLREGVLRRALEWESPAGTTVRISTIRLVSLTRRAIGAVRYEVEVLGDPTRITLQSELVANSHPSPVHDNPAIAKALDDPFVGLSHSAVDGRATLVHRTRASGIAIAVSMAHLLDAPVGTITETDVSEDLARTTVTATLTAGERIVLEKFVGHEWSADASADALRDRAEAAVGDAVRHAQWEGLAREQREYLDAFWRDADVEIGGDEPLQQAIRFALFEIVQASARSEIRPIPGKGLTGRGYDGHAFWDGDSFITSVLTYTVPDCARTDLIWRHSTLDHARDRARELSLAGATFPWRTIDGREASGYWPASTAAFHINADVAGAVVRYVRATGDDEFERRYGLEILVETARLWISLGRWDDSGGFHLDGMTGPDEYSAVADDNVYTNLMAQQNLAQAAAAAHRHPEVARRLGVDDNETAGWVTAASAMTVLFDEHLGVHPQAAGFLEHARWNFDAMTPEHYPLQANFHYLDLYRKQVVKQADLVLALYFRSDAFSADQKKRDFEYYEEITVRDSSLSAGPQAVIAAEVGHLDLALDYVHELAAMDLADLHRSADGGLHLASLAGLWTSLVAGFGGMRYHDDGLAFAPRLPSALSRLAFRVHIRGEVLHVAISQESATYSSASGAMIELHHHDEPVVVTAEPVTRPIAPLPVGPSPSQPRWRSPREVRARAAEDAEA